VVVDTPESEHFTVMPTENLVTSPKLAYLRLHGRNERGYVTGKTVAERFNYDYSDEEIAGVATRVGRLAEEAEEVHVAFNNNYSFYAPKSALALKAALGFTGIVTVEKKRNRIRCLMPPNDLSRAKKVILES